MTDKLPNEILIKILDFWKIDDFKNQYFNFKVTSTLNDSDDIQTEQCTIFCFLFLVILFY